MQTSPPERRIGAASNAPRAGDNGAGLVSRFSFLLSSIQTRRALFTDRRGASLRSRAAVMFSIWLRGMVITSALMFWIAVGIRIFLRA